MLLNDSYKSDSDQDAVNEILHTLASLSDAHENLVQQIHLDFRVDPARWTRLKAMLRSHRDDAASELCASFVKWCRDGQLRGWAADPKTSYLGRVTTRSRLRKSLLRGGESPVGARRVVDDLCTPSRFQRAIQYANRTDLQLGEHIVWATFSPHSDDPFPYEQTKNSLRKNLGLVDPAPEDDLEDLLLVFFSCPPWTYIPSFADAGSGCPPNPHFRINVNPTATYGLTHHPSSAPGIASRPEIVLAPVQVQLLTQSPIAVRT